MHFFNILPLLYVISIIVICCIPNTNAFSNNPTFIGGNNETDRLALLDIKSKIILEPHGILKSWNDSVNFCLWEGVTCSRRHNRVIELNLTAKGIVGTLSPFVGNLSFLHNLTLMNNTFRGSIPPQVGRLVRLQTLNLQGNEFEGGIPPNISGCLQLSELSLSRNKLVGNIPSELSLLSKLQILRLSKNNLTGSNLSPLSNLTSLKVLSLSIQTEQRGPGFQGTIPDFIGNFKDLTTLNLGDNSFTGMIPPSLYNLSKLQIFSIGENLLEGSLPPDIGSFFPQLQWLQIRNNRLSGPIPLSLSNLSNLELIQLGNNNFTGKFLLDARNMTNLLELNLDGANLGTSKADDLNFINTLVNCTLLKTLSIQNNNFGGVLPKSIVSLSTKLHFLSLSNNGISGSIPSGWSRYSNLEILSLSDNNFTGTIPPDIGMIPKLQLTSFSSNQLSGRIPSSLGNLSWLSDLSLARNQFHGAIPATLGNCKSLLVLDLDFNNLAGNIPHQIFQLSELTALYLSNNNLQGPLPSEIGDLKFLVTASLGNNNLSGNIPSSLGQSLGLTYLYLENNSFSGFIPPSLSNLKGLQVIDLSSNKLSGQVPKYFSNFSSLMLLNLSFNNFDGDVPTNGVFSNLSVVSLVGNNNLCGGIPQLNLPSCPKTESNKKKKIYVPVIIAVTISCVALLGLAIICSIYLMRRRKRRKASPISGVQNKEPFIKVSYDMLLKATNGFSERNLIGSGGYGSVYKGNLVFDGEEKVVAVKVIDNQRRGASKSFETECKALKTIRHRNLVGIITACSSIDFRGNVFQALVYELMSKGSLERWLYSNHEEDDQVLNLSLLQRLNIAIDVAHSMDYLHNGNVNPIIHCDLKPTNILLDDDMVAHVGDFGLVKLLPEVSNQLYSTSSLGVRGTVGYVAPEYGLGTSISVAGDVYSFGIILLELMTAKKPTDVMFDGGMSLRKFVESAVPDHVLEVVDTKLRVVDHNEKYDDKERLINLNDTRGSITKCAFECVTSILMTGVRCSSELPQDRMDIKDVVHELNSLRDRLLRCEMHRCQRIL